MLKEKLERGILPALVLFLICIVSTAALAGTYEITKEIRENRQKKALEANKKILFPEASSFELVELESDAPQDLLAVEKAYDHDQQLLGYFFQTSAKGYGGAILTLTGIQEDGTIAGVIFADNEETPGFGKKIEENWFQENFKGQAAGPSFTTDSPGENSIQIDQISGATISSDAACRAVNLAVKTFLTLEEKEVHHD